MESIIAIGRFCSEHSINRNGVPFDVKICVYQDKGEKILERTTECVFTENHGYHQIELGIDWGIDINFLRKNGIFQTYNTNFQNFKYDRGELIITNKTGNGFTIVLSSPIK